jgi:hypothetical protein
MGETTFELLQPTLGLDPFVLLRLRNGGGPDDVRVTIEWGGGISHGDIRDVLEAVLETLPEAEGDDHG